MLLALVDRIIFKCWTAVIIKIKMKLYPLPRRIFKILLLLICNKYFVQIIEDIYCVMYSAKGNLTILVLSSHFRVNFYRFSFRFLID